MEIGSTIGENYLILKKLANLEQISVELIYVGVEVEANLVEFARELHHDDKNATFVHCEASDLSRFPDQCFDLCISHGVSNYLVNAEVGLMELFRVCAVATVSHMHINWRSDSVNLTHGATGHRYWIPTFDNIKNNFETFAPIYIYHISKYQKVIGGTIPGSDEYYFIEDMNDLALNWDSFVFSRFNILPELSFICETVES